MEKELTQPSENPENWIVFKRSDGLIIEARTACAAWKQACSKLGNIAFSDVIVILEKDLSISKG